MTATSAMLTRFLRYIALDTRANGAAAAAPSSPGQMELARLLADELRGIGVADVRVDEHAYLTARLPGNGAAAEAPTIGLIAHLDTATEYPGGCANPRIVTGYDGTPITLSGITLDPAVFPELSGKQGKTLVITDGTTLLGGDDKAGIAVIMTVLDELTADPARPRPPIAVAFTPDEEIGHGAALLDIPSFGADFAYTVDGDGVGTIEYENFNAAAATVRIHGRSIHPGDAKGRMVNAILLGKAFLDGLPADERPETTEGRQGFYHVDSFSGTVAEARIDLLVRDHDGSAFAAKKKFLEKLAARLNAGIGGEPRIAVEIRDQYRNMVERIRPHMHIVGTAKRAMRALGVEPVEHPIRGGTDGAQLSWRGLPCPNLFDGSYNMHGPFEYVVVEEMRLAVDTIHGILAAYAEGKKD